MKYILETERLKLREFIHDDSGFIIELLNSPGWIKYIGDRNVKTTTQAINYLESGPIKSYRENGYGLYLVERKSGGESIGMCGILKRPYLEHPDMGFAFLPEYNGQGYAYEIVAATLKYAKAQLNLQVISAITMQENAGSIRLLEKAGLHFVKKINIPGDEEELLLYSG